MPDPIIKPGLYQHYSGKLYRVVGMAKHSETLEDLVVYEPQYVNPLSYRWVRPAAMFAEDVTIGGKTMPRFAFVNE